MESYELTSPRAMYAERAPRILRYPIALSKLQKLSFSGSEWRDNASGPEWSEISIVGWMSERVGDRDASRGGPEEGAGAGGGSRGGRLGGDWRPRSLRPPAPPSLARIRFLLIVYATGASEHFLIKTTVYNWNGIDSRLEVRMRRSKP